MMSTLKEEILDLVGSSKKETLDRNAIAKKLNLTSGMELAELDKAMDELEESAELFRGRGNRYMNREQSGVYVGLLHVRFLMVISVCCLSTFFCSTLDVILYIVLFIGWFTEWLTTFVLCFANWLDCSLWLTIEDFHSIFHDLSLTGNFSLHLISCLNCQFLLFVRIPRFNYNILSLTISLCQ